MTKSPFATGAALMLVLPVMAQAAEFTAMDTNQDGYLTVSELQAALPDLSEDDFNAVDVNADGVLNEAEVAAAQSEGIFPSGDG